MGYSDTRETLYLTAEQTTEAKRDLRETQRPQLTRAGFIVTLQARYIVFLAARHTQVKQANVQFL